MAKNQYQWLYDTQTQPLKTYVLDEVAKLLAGAVEQWPPKLEQWEREDQRARFEPLLAQVREPPGQRVIAAALQLYRWELEREVELIDRYMRGEHWQEHRLGPMELETVLFLWQYWTDQTLAFKEYAQGKFRQSELLGLADRLESRLLHARSALRQ